MSRPWGCEQCNKIFTRRGDLQRHNNIHYGLKPYQCGECGKCFSQQTGLKTHSNVHTGLKPYICDVPRCSAAFGDPSSCARHIKETHRISSGYRCFAEGCQSKIKRKSAFNAHLRKKHNIDPSTVDWNSLAPAISPSIGSSKRRRGRGVVTSLLGCQDGKGELVDTPFEEGESPISPNELEPAGYYGSPAFYEQSTSKSYTPIGLPDVLNAGLYTMDSPVATPPLSFSQSPSPAPSNGSPHFNHGGMLMTPFDSTGCYQTLGLDTRPVTPCNPDAFSFPVYDANGIRNDLSWEDLFVF